MHPADLPPTLDYAKPALQPAARVHRKTVIGVFVVDEALMLVGGVLAAFDVQSWLVAGPILALNLPALPVACVFSVFFEGRTDPSASVTVVRGVAMFLFEAIVSSLTWGWVVARLRGVPSGPRTEH